MLGAERMTHWAMPVRDIEASEAFYGEFLGLEHVGRLGGSRASVYRVGGISFILFETGLEADPRLAEANVHYAFTVSPEVWDRAILAIHEHQIELRGPIVYRARGTFPGREVYLFDPSRNVVELTDPTWSQGMPEPTYEEIIASPVRG